VIFPRTYLLRGLWVNKNISVKTIPRMGKLISSFIISIQERHFSDPEIFSKPLILFMGPWSGGKSSILNYLTDNEYTPNSLRTGEY